MEKNQKVIALISVIAMILIAIVLIVVASGGSYDLQVKDPQKGAENAVIVIEEFSDFQCPACKAAAIPVAAAIAQFPETVQFVYRDFPLPSHNRARTMAIAGLCAAQQGKFQEVHDRFFAEQSDWASPQTDIDLYLQTLAQEEGLNEQDWNTCRDSKDARDEVQRDVNEGNDRGVDSTPTFYLNGKKVENPGSTFGWVTLIKEELEAIDPSLVADEEETEETEELNEPSE